MNPRKPIKEPGVLSISEEQIISLRKKISRKYFLIRHQNLTLKTTPNNYIGLREEITTATEIEISLTWLRDFFCDDATKGWTKQTNYLNPLCSFIYGAAIKAEKFLNNYPKPITDVLGVYDVYWTGMTANTINPIYSTDQRLSMLESRVVLIRHKQQYSGGAPTKLGDKVYLELIGLSNNEKVYFILHVGDAEEANLDYIPGLFSSGDNGNIKPCSGPVMLMRIDPLIKRAPNYQLLYDYFRDYTGNNLIKGWTISDVTEKTQELSPHHLDTSLIYDSKAILRNKLALYFNQKFYFYYWTDLDGREAPKIGRATIEIGPTNNSVILRSPTGASYTGSIELGTIDHLHIRLRTAKTQEKHQSIKLRIGPEKIFPYAIGLYSIIENHGAVVAGTCILEHCDPHIAVPEYKPSLFALDKTDKILNPFIFRFLGKKEQNFLKIKSEGIFTESDFSAFFEDQDRKKQYLSRPHEEGIFIASPMSANIEEFEQMREQVLVVQKNLGDIYNTHVYYAGKDYKSNVGFTHAFTAAELDFKMLQGADKFLLIHPMKTASSTLIELGWALAQKKSCVIFYKDQADLPFLVRGLQQDNVKKIPYTTMENLLAIIKHLKTQLFP